MISIGDEAYIVAVKPEIFASHFECRGLRLISPRNDEAFRKQAVKHAAALLPTPMGHSDKSMPRLTPPVAP